MLERTIFIVSGSRFDPNSVTRRDFVMSEKRNKTSFFPTVQLTYLITVTKLKINSNRVYSIAFPHKRIKTI